MKKSKIMVMALVGSMLLTMTACGGTKKTNDTEETTTVIEETEEKEVAEESSDDAKDTPDRDSHYDEDKPGHDGEDGVIIDDHYVDETDAVSEEGERIDNPDAHIKDTPDTAEHYFDENGRVKDN